MRLDHAGLVAVILGAGVAVALSAVLIIIALKGDTSAADAELIGVVSSLAGTAIGAVCGWLASVPSQQDKNPQEPASSPSEPGT